MLVAEDAGDASPNKQAAPPAPAAGATATKESAAARRRRLAREKAEAKSAAGGAKRAGGKGGAAGEGAPEPPAGGAPFGDSGPGASFTSEQLFAQLAGSIDMRQRSELREVEESESKTLARISAALAKDKEGLRRSVPDPEARQLEAAKLDAAARGRSAEARDAARTKSQEIRDKFKLVRGGGGGQCGVGTRAALGVGPLRGT